MSPCTFAVFFPVTCIAECTWRRCCTVCFAGLQLPIAACKADVYSWGALTCTGHYVLQGISERLKTVNQNFFSASKSSY